MNVLLFINCGRTMIVTLSLSHTQCLHDLSVYLISVLVYTLIQKLFYFLMLRLIDFTDATPINNSLEYTLELCAKTAPRDVQSIQQHGTVLTPLRSRPSRPCLIQRFVKEFTQRNNEVKQLTLQFVFPTFLFSFGKSFHKYSLKLVFGLRMTKRGPSVSCVSVKLTGNT